MTNPTTDPGLPAREPFSPDMLPILGVVWRQFPTEHDAKTFANYATRTTRHHDHPCRSSYALTDDGTWVVKVSNW